MEFIKNIKEIHTNYEDIIKPLKGASKRHLTEAFIPIKINYIIYGFVSYEYSYKVY